MNNGTPYFDYVLIEPVEVKQVLISDTKKIETFGKVLSVGKDVRDTKVGDVVAFEMWDVKDCSINEKKLYLVQESRLIFKFDLSVGLVP